MRHACLDAAVYVVECDEATPVGVLDRCRIGDPGQRRRFNRLRHRQGVNDFANRRWERSDARFDQFDQARRGTLGSPIHRQ